MSDEAPNWLDISYSLKELLSEYNIAELDSIGHCKQRLTFECFQVIVYHLFLIIDSNDCKRKFRLIYPSKNSQDQNRFLDQAVIFINSRKLTQTRVASSQLRTCGGEVFRLILGKIIDKAVKLVTDRIIKRNKSLTDYSNKSFDELVDQIDFVEKGTNDLIEEIKKDFEIIKQYQETINSSNIDDNCKQVPDKKELLNKFKDSSAKCCNAIKDIKTYNEKIHTDMSCRSKNLMVNQLKEQHSNQVKRISQIIREVEDSPNNPKIDVRLKRIGDFDEKLDQIVSNWKQQVFEMPDIQERYEILKRLIPPISIRPINWPLNGIGISYMS